MIADRETDSKLEMAIATRENKIFGVPFDPPNSPERLDIKLAYVSHVMNLAHPSETFFDPYDVIKAGLTAEPGIYPARLWAGKMPVDSWLTPRPYPAETHLLTPLQAASFLEADGCWDYALKVANFVEESIFPHRPVMIGVDHSLSGGMLLALARKYDNLNVIVMDAHFDIMGSNGLISPFRNHKSEDEPGYYHCGNFLAMVLEKGIIRPENLWVLGVAEETLRGQSPDNEKEIKKWTSSGVHLAPKEVVSSGGLSLNLSGPTYISIDMDVGSLSSVFSARFMNCYGLMLPEFLALLSQLKRSIKECGVPLVGMDIMEIDIHFLEAAELMPYRDYTRYIAGRALEILLQDELV